MDKEYRNLLKHAETENDFIRIERIQVRKGLRTPTIFINNYRKYGYYGTRTSRTEIGTMTGTRTGARTMTGIRTGTRTKVRTETRIIIKAEIGTMAEIRPRAETWIMTGTITNSSTWIRTHI